ncbi:MAG TPA: hypothetical protein DCY23_03690, partial [Ruminococcaceae bacterium]|nr:hypothetical protein [Oscillospiraceae bacterium]
KTAKQAPAISVTRYGRGFFYADLYIKKQQQSHLTAAEILCDFFHTVQHSARAVLSIKRRNYNTNR